MYLASDRKKKATNSQNKFREFVANISRIKYQN